MKLEHVAGRKKGDITLFALSTCGWCKKTKALLGELGVDYNYVFVDLIPEEEKDEVMKEVMKWNPDCSFPTLVVDNKTCLVGFRPDEMKELLGK
jgi:glutaredoxin-like protein NrdH